MSNCPFVWKISCCEICGCGKALAASTISPSVTLIPRRSISWRSRASVTSSSQARSRIWRCSSGVMRVLPDCCACCVSDSTAFWYACTVIGSPFTLPSSLGAVWPVSAMIPQTMKRRKNTTVGKMMNFPALLRINSIMWASNSGSAPRGRGGSVWFASVPWTAWRAKVKAAKILTPAIRRNPCPRVPRTAARVAVDPWCREA